MAFLPARHGPLMALLTTSAAALAGCSSGSSDQEHNRRPAMAVAVVPAERQNEFNRATAPSAGVITNKAVETDSAVSTNQRLFGIADDALLVVRGQMSEPDVVHAADNDSDSVRLDAQPGVRLRGWVRRAFPSAEPAARLVPVEVGLARPPPTVQIQPGILVRAELSVERRNGTLDVPAGAIGATFVFVVENDT